MSGSVVDIGYKIALYFVPFLFALCFHEYAHGWVARRLGDNTAERMGRLTLNPFAHADLLGTFILPIAAILFGTPFFGWAQPVPVDERNLKSPKNDMFWVALAGPGSNLLLAVVAVVMFVVAAHMGSSQMMELAKVFLIINLFLAFFNLLPLHPLDGGKIIARFLPYNANRWLEDNASTFSWVLLGLFLLGGFKYLAIPVYALAQWMLMLGASF